MKSIILLALMALAPAAMAEPMKPMAAESASLADFLYTARVVVVFAPAPEDPNFMRQMEMLAQDNGDLAARDVVLLMDTDPAARSALRTSLRPSGFSLVILDKDGRTALRKPRPWSLREIIHAIDKFPSRRDEVFQRPMGATPIP